MNKTPLFAVALLTTIVISAGNSMAADSSDDNFFSSTISSITDKMNDYASGRKSLAYDDSDAEGVYDGQPYTRNAMGQRVPTETVRGGMTSSPDEPL